ncbi:MAG: GNAT family protein [Candidatus Paceibacterota bacterium]
MEAEVFRSVIALLAVGSPIRCKEASMIFFKKGARTALGLVEEKYIPLFLKLLNDQDRTAPNLRRTFPITEEDERGWIKKAYSGPYPTNLPFLIVALDLPTPEVIGTVGFGEIDYINRTATTGTMIVEEARGKGYGTEAKHLLLAYAFNALNLRAVKSHVYAFNKASLRVQEKCGYKEVARLPGWCERGNEFFDEVILIVTYEEWLEHQSN